MDENDKILVIHFSFVFQSLPSPLLVSYPPLFFTLVTFSLSFPHSLLSFLSFLPILPLTLSRLQHYQSFPLLRIITPNLQSFPQSHALPLFLHDFYFHLSTLHTYPSYLGLLLLPFLHVMYSPSTALDIFPFTPFLKCLPVPFTFSFTFMSSSYLQTC